MTANTKDLFIKGKKVYLRAYAPGDEEMIARIENHPDSRNALFYNTPTTTEFQAEKSKRQLSDPNSVVFTICKVEDNDPIGQTALFRIDWVGGMGTFYVGIADKVNHSRGYGQEATMLLCEYAFLTLNLLSPGEIYIRLFDLNGRVVFRDQTAYSGDEFTYSLPDLSYLPDGIYTLEVSDGDHMKEMSKLIKQ